MVEKIQANMEREQKKEKNQWWCVEQGTKKKQSEEMWAPEKSCSSSDFEDIYVLFY